MDNALKQTIERIHRSPTQVVLYVTGGASHVLSWLLSVPGASGTILEAAVPYERAAFVDIVGKESASPLTSFSSPSAAHCLARAAYKRAVRLAPPGTRVCGIAAACSLATTGHKKGEHQAFVATYASNRIAEYNLTLKKGYRTRWDEEEISSRLVLQAMLDDIGETLYKKREDSGALNERELDILMLSQQSPMVLVRDRLVSGDKLSGPVVSEMTDCLQAVLGGDAQYGEFAYRSWNRDATSASLIFPGSFNPLHEGHCQLMNTAKSMYPDRIPAFEISAINPDKPPLEPKVILNRLSQFSEKDVVLVTRAPLFVTKAEFFPSSIFVVGVDTALRIVAPKYYEGKAGMIASLMKMKVLGCKFAVAGRIEQRKTGIKSNTFQTLSDVDIPLGFEDMFEAIPSAKFRQDISSSELRAMRRKS